MGKMPNPATEKMTDAQKKMLREIHEKYGKPGKNPLHVMVQPGGQQPPLEIALK